LIDPTYLLYFVLFVLPGLVAASLARDILKSRRLSNNTSNSHVRKASNVKKEEPSPFEKGEEIPQVKEHLKEAVPWLNEDGDEEEIQN